MPETIDQTFRDEKNKAQNSPILLYELTMNDASLVRLAEWDAIVEFPTGSGYNYLPFPLTHEGISVNILGEIDVVKVSMSAVNREIVAVLIQNDGLRGNKVVLKLVFADHLDDPTACLESTYYVDAAEITEQRATFILTSKLDIINAVIPGREFQRHSCVWVYKGEGCYLEDGMGGFTAPSGFLHSDVECDKTLDGAVGCVYHANKKRFGGFPAIPLKGLYVI